VGVIPIVAFAPVYIAKEQGYFAEAGIKVDLRSMQNAAAIAPAVMNGQLQIGTAANVPYLTARSKGLPILALGGGAASTTGDAATDYSGVFVASDSAIKRPRDLMGKTVTTNNLKNVLQLAVVKAVKDDGGDPSKVRFVAMPFPNMVPALKKGRVDAIAVPEPFYSVAAKAGVRLLDNPFTTAYPKDTSLALYFFSKKWSESHPDVAQKFDEALTRAGSYAANHPEAVRQVMVEELGMDAAQVIHMRIPGFGAPVKPDSLEQVAQLMVDSGFIQKAPAQADLVWEP
jgi:NitT/TauT family transport system substrate-binding protein